MKICCIAREFAHPYWTKKLHPYWTKKLWSKQHQAFRTVRGCIKGKNATELFLASPDFVKRC